MEKLKQDAARLNERLSAVLQGSQPMEKNVEHALSRLRSTYEDIIFLDYETAQRDEIETRIWASHQKVFRRYNSSISSHKNTNGKKKPVELRKLIAGYTNVLKSATKFYRSFIQRLACHFCLSELEPVLKQFRLDYVLTPDCIQPSADLKKRLFRSVHSALIYLGDLSRYREGHGREGAEKNWGPAIGYYNLAIKLVPELGWPHNQLAVIARSGGSTVSFTYHLYRAVSVAEPHPESVKNVDLGFKKILDAKAKGKTTDEDMRKEEKPVSELLEDFLMIHANYAKGIELPDQDAIQTEMVWQLVSDLRERNLSTGMLNKLVTINIAAEYYFRSSPADKRVPSSLMKLNVETFNNLLLVFQPQLERMKDGSESTVDRLTAVGRRMLPGLRLYSRWLLNNHETITKTMRGSMQLKQLWQTYADTLSILSSSFSVDTLPHLEYPLEEDEQMVGFLPVVQKHAQSGWEPFLSEDTSYRVHPNEEMLARVLALLEDCVDLCSRPTVPITIIDGMITYQEEGNVVCTPSIGSQRHEAVEFNSPGGFKPVTATLTGSGFEANAGSATISETGSYSLSARLDRMVDSLVGPRDDPILERDEEEDDGLGLPLAKQTDGPEDDEDEEIVFVGRNARHSSENRTPQLTPAIHQAPSSPALPAAPPPSSNVNDLVNYVQTFSKRMEASSPSIPPATPHAGWGAAVPSPGLAPGTPSASWGNLAPSPSMQQIPTTYHTLSSLYYPPGSPAPQRRINSPIFSSPWNDGSNATPPAGQGQYYQGRG